MSRQQADQCHLAQRFARLDRPLSGLAHRSVARHPSAGTFVSLHPLNIYDGCARMRFLPHALTSRIPARGVPTNLSG